MKAGESSRKFEERLERLLKDAKKNEKKKWMRLLKAEEDEEVWKKKLEGLERKGRLHRQREGS